MKKLLLICLFLALSFPSVNGADIEFAAGIFSSSPEFSPDGTKIVFESNRNRTYHIWVRDSKGTKMQELSKLAWDMEPAWSPDGKMIAFASYGKSKLPEGHFAIWLMNADGTNPHQLIEPDKEGDQYPFWSPDGKRIVWSHGKQLWIMDNNGENAHPLTTKPAGAFECCGDWSPDGKLIAYVAREDYSGDQYKIWLIEPDGKGQRLFSTGIEAHRVKWSRDGKYLYYDSCPGIMKIDIQAKESTKKILDLQNDCVHFDISPDEKWIVYDDSGIDGSGKLYIKPLK